MTTQTPATVTIWQSNNNLHTIQRHDTRNERMQIEEGDYTYTNNGPGCPTYKINAHFMAYVYRCLELYKTHQVTMPAYVCRAIIKHTTEETQP